MSRYQQSRYQQSETFLQQVLKLIPSASQTFSKSLFSLPYGASPFFLEKGQGSRVWDLDGHEYLDFISGLLCISLGYRDPDVDAAVRRQMENGVSFSLPHPLEYQVAEKLAELIPCAEMIRFGKNGTDATSAAVRLARAYTGRDHVAVGGYHGWQDWYIGSTSRDLGVPGATRELTHRFLYNDIASLEALFARLPNRMAAVILEPMTFDEPRDNFLEQVKHLCQRNGTVLVFDETITGFHFSLGGAQQTFGVVPDLATFGKGMANGYPLSAIVGQRDIMQLMDEIFFSGTFGGETLSLAAAAATIDKMRREPVLENIRSRGEKLLQAARTLIDEENLGELIGFSGHPAWTLVTFRDVAPYSMWEIKTLWLQECLKRGILIQSSHNLSYAHSEADIDRLLAVYREVLPWIRDVVAAGNLHEHLDGKVLEPLFKVR